MPNTHSTLSSLFTDIADAIRAKTGSAASIVADNFPTEIANIPSGGGGTLITKSITANGTYNAEDDNADGYSSVTVAVPTGGKIIPSIPAEYTKVDYIEGTGTQYFDAGLITGGSNPVLTVYIDFQITTSFANNYLIGSKGNVYCYMRASNTDILQIRDSSIRDIKNIGKSRTKFQTTFSPSAPLYIDDTLYSFINYSTPIRYDSNLSFFDMYGERQGTKGKYRLYYAEIIHPTNISAYDYTPRVYQYVPCIRNSDGKPGVYCVGLNTFIPSATSTDFVIPT